MLIPDYGFDSPDPLGSTDRQWPGELPPFESVPRIELPQLLYSTTPSFTPAMFDDRLIPLPDQLQQEFLICNTEEFLRYKLCIPPHLPVNLYALPDPPAGRRPHQSLPDLVMLAIHGSPRKMLTLQEIYKAIENRFEWYRRTRSRKEGKAWKGSIRHCLSLWMVFRHRPRPITESGRGHYWYIDLSNGEGYKREHKRRRGGCTSDPVGANSEDYAAPRRLSRPCC